MPRRLIAKITLDHEYVNLEALNLAPGPVALPKYGEGSDYFKGAAPSDLKVLDNRQLFMVFNRLCLTLSEGRGMPDELAKSWETYDAIIQEAKSRRATLHD
jgi:hypothetical protein